MTTKCKIRCDSHSYARREYEITADGRVWPCCLFANAWQLKDNGNDMSPLLLEDGQWVVRSTIDPDWNSLHHHSLDDIVADDFFAKYIYYPGWEGRDQPPLCKKECGLYIDEVTGRETTKARLD